MDELLDILWSKIVIGVGYVVAFLDMVLAPLENFGPGVVILVTLGLKFFAFPEEKLIAYAAAVRFYVQPVTTFLQKIIGHCGGIVN